MRQDARGLATKIVSSVLIALATGAGVEGLARLLETRAGRARAFDFSTIPGRMNVDEATGEPQPPFLVPADDGWMAGPFYTDGSRCYPFHCQSIPAQKPSREFRIGCFGESTTAGFDLLHGEPYRGFDRRRDTWPAGAPFCELLAQQLAPRLPDRQVVAFNFGADAFDSERILPVAREIARKVPLDLWVVYMGHNEFLYAPDLIEPYSTVSRLSSALRRHLALVRLADRAERSRAQLIARGRVRRYSPDVFVRSASYAQSYEEVLTAYEGRLREMVALARGSGATVLLAEPVSNHIPGVAEEHAFNCFARTTSRAVMTQIWGTTAKATDLERNGRYAEALAEWEGIATLEPGYEPAGSGRTRCLLAQGERQRALEQDYRAKDENPLPTVATRSVSEIVRRVAVDTKTALARTLPVFDEIFLNDPQGYPGLFSDDCHPTREGHRLIADRLLAAWEEARPR